MTQAQKPWYSNGCKYKCQECAISFDDIAKLTSHLKVSHKTRSIKNYLTRFKKVCFQKTTFYTCQLCKVRIKLQHSTIRKHLTKAHHIKLKDYTLQFHPCNTFLGHDKSHDLSEDYFDMKSFEDWNKGSCRYKCNICHDQFNRSSNFWSHVKEVHSETIASYKHQFGGDSCSTPSNVIECHGCFKLIRHDTMHIRRHAKRSHGMSSKQ